MPTIYKNVRVEDIYSDDSSVEEYQVHTIAISDEKLVVSYDQQEDGGVAFI